MSSETGAQGPGLGDQPPMDTRPVLGTDGVAFWDEWLSSRQESQSTDSSGGGDRPFDWSEDDDVNGVVAGEATYAAGLHKPTDPHEDIKGNLDWISSGQPPETLDDSASSVLGRDSLGNGLLGEGSGEDQGASTDAATYEAPAWLKDLLRSHQEPQTTDADVSEEGATATPTPESADGGDERVVVWTDEGHAVVVTKEEEADARQASQQAAEKTERKKQAKDSRKEKRKEFRTKTWERIQDFVESSKDWLREHPNDKRGRAVRYVGMAAVGTVVGVAGKHVPIPVVDLAEQVVGYAGHKGAGFLGGAATGYSDSKDHVLRSGSIAAGTGVSAGLAEGLVGTDGSVAAVVGFGAGKAAKRFKGAYQEGRAAYKAGAEYDATEVKSTEPTTSSTSEPTTSRPAVRPINDAETRPRTAKPAVSDGVGQRELGRIKRGKGQR